MNVEVRRKTMKKCNICGKPIKLFPGAKDRARKFGGKPSDFTALFDTHAACHIEKQRKETSELIRRRN